MHEKYNSKNFKPDAYSFLFFFDNLGIRTLVRLSHRVQPELEDPGGQTETMLNPLWPGLELVMADTSAEVPIPPDYEAHNIVN